MIQNVRSTKEKDRRTRNKLTRSGHTEDEKRKEKKLRGMKLQTKIQKHKPSL